MSNALNEAGTAKVITRLGQLEAEFREVTGSRSRARREIEMAKADIERIRIERADDVPIMRLAAITRKRMELASQTRRAALHLRLYSTFIAILRDTERSGHRRSRVPDCPVCARLKKVQEPSIGAGINVLQDAMKDIKREYRSAWKESDAASQKIHMLKQIADQSDLQLSNLRMCLKNASETFKEADAKVKELAKERVNLQRTLRGQGLGRAS